MKIKRKKKAVSYRKHAPRKYKAGKVKILMSLGAIPKEGVPEIKVRYNKSRKKSLGKISQSDNAADFIRKLYTRGTIELQESFIVLYLNNQNEIIGYYKHTTGGINATIADLRLILGTALKSASTSLIVAHNHPSGNLTPSSSDEKLTKEIKKGAELLNLRLLDHIIVTKKEYFSFADNNYL